MGRKEEKEQSKIEKIEETLLNNYEFFYNEITSRCEYKVKSKDNEFKPINKHSLNSITRFVNKELGLSIYSEAIRGIIESDFSPTINPIKDYFNNLTQCDPKEHGYIKMLADTIETTNKEDWEKYLTKWITAVVANAIDDNNCKNHTCLVLTGKQGVGKTTWLNNLCPKSLKRYIYVGKIQPYNKDSLTQIAENLLINIDDQLVNINKTDENQLKDLITLQRVKYRKPYDISNEEYPHRASFMASINGTEFLNDPTGNRRFLPIEVISIDIEGQNSINMDDVYSEAMWLLKEGYKFWFDNNEIEELNQNNGKFYITTVEYDLLNKFFTAPNADEESYMTSTEIMTEMKMQYSGDISLKKVSEALTKSGYKKFSKRLHKGRDPVSCYKIKIVRDNK